MSQDKTPNFRCTHITRWTGTLALLSLTFGCSLNNSQQKSVNHLSISPMTFSETAAYFVVSQSKSILPCSQTDPFNESVKFALQAAQQSQLAKTQEEWNDVANLWVQAVAWMQAVPIESSRRPFAEKKVVEYMRNLVYSQQQTVNHSQFNYPSFSSYLLDSQLKLYLSYLASVGPPDILIVGSSRALMGVDPKQLKFNLAKRGYPNLKIFNFGVNGATAQVVDFQLRQLLTPNMLPKMIIWADGVRAFNSGRVDKTYNSIISSHGTKLLAKGQRPKLAGIEPDLTSTCFNFPNAACAATMNTTNLDLTLVKDEMALPVANQIIVQPKLESPTNMTENEIAATIDAQGFLPRFTKFNPVTYYQERPYVAGSFDRDYADFNLDGKQGEALDSIINFTKSRNISLVIVNLPLTEDYLDDTRWWAENQFQKRMENLSRNNHFTWIDLSEKWGNRRDYFIDPSHLNRYGAIAVSRQLSIENKINWPKNPE